VVKQEDVAMPTNYQTEPLKVGTIVRIRNSGYGQARAQITEFRGPLGPNGTRVYGVRIGKKPAAYTEVPEEELEVVPPEES
jgi:hypothetical protein